MRVGIQPLSFPDELSALRRSDRGDGAGINNDNVRRVVSGVSESKLFEELANLLGFVLVDFATESMDGKSFHGTNL